MRSILGSSVLEIHSCEKQNDGSGSKSSTRKHLLCLVGLVTLALAGISGCTGELNEEETPLYEAPLTRACSVSPNPALVNTTFTVDGTDLGRRRLVEVQVQLASGNQSKQVWTTRRGTLSVGF